MRQLLSVPHFTQSHPFIGYRSVIVIYPQNKDSLYTSRSYFSSTVQENNITWVDSLKEVNLPIFIGVYILYMQTYMISYIKKSFF